MAALASSDAACLCPPCAAAPGASPATPALTSPSTESKAAVVTPPSTAASGRLVIWDGDKASAGQGWADCDKKPTCKATVAKAGSIGADGSVGIKFHGEGPGWIGMGWNWFGWYPETAGTDLTPYTNLTFQMRVEGKSAETAPDPGAVSASLGCSKGKKNSADASIQKYTADFTDGKWHKVVIPIADLTSGVGTAFDRATAWEFRISNWSATPRDFNIYVDDIAIEQ